MPYIGKDAQQNIKIGTIEDVEITGDLQVQGTTTTIDSTTVTIKDKNILLGKGYSISANDGAGLTVDNSGSNDASILYEHSTTSWDFNKPVNITGNVTATGTVTIGQSSTNAYTSADNLIVGTGSGHNGMTIFSGNANQGTIFFADALGGNSDASTYDGYIIYDHTSSERHFRFGTAGGERVRIKSTGEVGIGDDSPDNKMNIKESALASRSASNGNTSLTIEHATDTGIQFFSATQTQLRFGDAASTGAGSIIYTHSDNTLTFNTSEAARIKVDGDGRIGIGATPNTNIHASTFPAALSLGDQGVLLGSASSTQLGHNFYWSGSAFKYLGSGKASRMYQQAGDIVFQTTDTSGSADGALTLSTALTIDSSQDATFAGNVAINHGSSGKLSVYDGSTALFRLETPGILAIAHSWDGSNYTIANNDGSSGHPIIFGSKSSGGETMRLGSTGEIQIGGTSSAGFIDFDGTSLQLNTQRNPNTGTFVNTGKSHAAINLKGSDGGSSIEMRTHAANNANASSVRFKIDKNGMVGIGQTSLPAADNPYLTVGTNNYALSHNGFSQNCYFNGSSYTAVANGAGKLIQSGDDLIFYHAASVNAGSSQTLELQMTLLANGNLRMGVGNSRTPVLQGTTNHGRTEASPGFTFNDDLDTGMFAPTVNTIAFTTGGTERLRIASGAEVTAYMTSGNSYILNDGTPSSGNAKFYVNANGGIYNYQSNDSNLSDEREKKNIATLGSKWDAVKKWDLKEFHYNSDEDSDSKKCGVIAQDVETDHPELITDYMHTQAVAEVKDDDGNIVTEAVDSTTRKAVKEQQMTWMAIKALQEAMAKIETLEAKVAALEGS